MVSGREGGCFSCGLSGRPGSRTWGVSGMSLQLVDERNAIISELSEPKGSRRRRPGSQPPLPCAAGSAPRSRLQDHLC